MTDADNTSRDGLLSPSALGNTTTKFSDDNLSPDRHTTQREFPSQTTLSQMDNMCRDLGLQHTRENRLPERSIPDAEMEAPPASASSKPPFSRTSWILAACGKCVEAKHIIKHKEICGTTFGGKTYNCKQKECRRMISVLWKANFIHSDDCNHSNSEALSREPSSVCEPQGRSHKSPQRGNTSTQLRNKAIQPKYKATRTVRGRYTRRTGRQSDSHMAERFLEFGESARTLDKQFGLPDMMSAPAPEDLATAHAEVLCPLESFNKDILETYPDKAIQEDFVENTWKWLARNISAYDYFVRGIHSKPEVRNKLEVLDGIAPLSDLPDIRMEMELPEKFGPQSTILLPVLKSMFSVPLDRSLRSVICLSSDQIRRMNFSYVLRAILAYILHQEIFSVEENALFWRTIERCLKAVHGEREGSATLQYCRLETLKLDTVKASLESRAQQLAQSIYTMLLPLSHLVKDSPNNDKAKHLELLEKITHQSLYLAHDLQAREGKFEFLWPKNGVLFDPDFYTVDDSQTDDVQRMDYEIKKKQMIIFTLMPAVQLQLPNEERVLRYAPGVVLLKKPYVDYRRQ